MAEKNYAFDWSNYFVGIEQANLYLYLRDIFFKRIHIKDLKKAITAHSIMADILGGHYGFVGSDYGNFSRNIRGLTAFASRSRNSIFAEQLAECNMGKGWLGAVCADIDTGYSHEFSENIDEIIGFFQIIMDEREYIQTCHSDTLGFDANVLQQLLTSLKQSAQHIKIASFENKKLIYGRCLIMGLTYFLSNGQDFLKLTKNDTSPDTQLFCHRYAQQIPADNFEADSRLFAQFSHNGKKADSLMQLAEMANGKHIFVVGDGGAGKTTAMRHAAREYNRNGMPAVYIPCSRLDNLAKDSRDLQCFVADYIGSAFDEYAKLAQEAISASRVVQNLTAEKLPYANIMVFLDGFNETSATATLYRQIMELAETTDNLQFVINSRYTSHYFKDDFIQAKIEPLEPENTLSPQKYSIYSRLDARTQQFLKTPMFLRLFMLSENTDNITAASLLMQDFQRTIQKNPVPSVLKVFLPAFALYCYTDEEKMAFTYETLTDVAKNYTFADVDTIINALKISGYILTEDDYNFVFRHEHIRDFLVALSISDKISAGIKNARFSQLIIDIFSQEKSYSMYIRRFMAELMGEDTITAMLESLSVSRLADDVWTSHKNALATARVTDLVKIITDNSTDIDYYGLNLSLTSLNGTQVTDSYFAHSLVSDFTFAAMGHGSAVFAICTDDSDNIYALGKSRLIKYSPDLIQLDAIDYPNGNTITSHGVCGNVFGAVSYTGDAYIFDISQKLTVIGQFTGAVSVQSSTGGLLFGMADGCVAFFDTKGRKQWQVQVDNCPVMPVRNRISSEIMYATAHSLKLWNRRGGTKVLWTSQENMAVIRTGYNAVCRSAVLVANRFGRTDIIAYDENTEQTSIVMENIASEELSDYLVQQSVGIDPTKCTGIIFTGRYMANIYNNGHILTYRYLNNQWEYFEDITVVNTKANNSGTGIESGCFVTDGIVCGLTNRTLKIISFSFDDIAGNGTEKHKASGYNSGLRRIFTADRDNLYATMYDNGFIHLQRNSEGRFAFADKVFLGNDWCWAGAVLAEGKCAFALGDTVYIYDGKVQPCHKFSGKVENLFAKENMLFAAVGSNVYTIDCLNNFKTQLVADSDNGRRAICFASNPLDNKIYIGYSFHADKKSACLVKIYEDNALQPVENSLWKYADGWYRSIEFSPDGRYIFCTGLKEQNTEGNWQNISVLFDSDFNQLAILEGHTDSVMKGVFLSADTSQLVMATCSYDGFVNIYQADISALGKETRLSPARTSPDVNSRIMDMTVDKVTILACCMDGRIYRWCYGENNSAMETEYENICGLWTSYCDLSQTDKRSQLSPAIYNQLAALNNQMPDKERSE